MEGNTNMKEAIELVRGLRRAPTGNFYMIDQDEMIRLIGYLADGVASLSSAQELAMVIKRAATHCIRRFSLVGPSDLLSNASTNQTRPT